MMIEPGAPTLGDNTNDDVTLRLRLRELLDPAFTDNPGDAQADSAQQLRQLIEFLQPIAAVLEATAQALGDFQVDDYDDDPEAWARDIADLDRLTVDHDNRLRAVLLAFDEALADHFQV